MLKTIRRSYIIVSLISIAIGVVLFMFPAMSLKVVCGIFGAVILLFGLLKIFLYIKNKEIGFVGQFGLIVGILFSVIGVFLLLSPNIIVSILPIIIGIYIVIDSFQNFKQALDLYKAEYAKWWVMMVLAFVLAVLGVVIILNPFKTAAVGVMYVGGIFIFNGISNIFSVIFTNRKIKKSFNVIDVEPKELRKAED